MAGWLVCILIMATRLDKIFIIFCKSFLCHFKTTQNKLVKGPSLTPYIEFNTIYHRKCFPLCNQFCISKAYIEEHNYIHLNSQDCKCMMNCSQSISSTHLDLHNRKPAEWWCIKVSSLSYLFNWWRNLHPLSYDSECIILLVFSLLFSASSNFVRFQNSPLTGEWLISVFFTRSIIT